MQVLMDIQEALTHERRALEQVNVELVKQHSKRVIEERSLPQPRNKAQHLLLMLEAAQSSRDHAQAKLDGIPYQVETEKVTRLRVQLTQTEEEAAQLSGRLLEQRKSVERIKGDTQPLEAALQRAEQQLQAIETASFETEQEQRAMTEAIAAERAEVEALKKEEEETLGMLHNHTQDIAYTKSKIG